MLNADQHQDLRLRLEQLVSELAPASDRTRAIERVGEALSRVPVVDVDMLEEAAATLDAREAKIVELRDVTEALRADVANAGAALQAARQEVTRLTEELAQAKAAKPPLTIGGGDGGAGGGGT